MMGDLNRALNTVYSHLNSFSPHNINEAAEALHEDNAMLKGMQQHALDAKGEKVAKDIYAQISTLQQTIKSPSLGAQQLSVAKYSKELRKVKEGVENILKRINQKPNRAVEKNAKSKTE